MVFTIIEVLEIIGLTVVVGWIFKDMLMPERKPEDVIDQYTKGTFEWHSWAWAALLVAPAIILHEFGHKFVALAFDLTATFNAAWGWIAIAIVMKLIAGFVFFVPAYVAISGPYNPLHFGLAAFAGPLVNFALWGLALAAPSIRKQFRGKKITHKEFVYWTIFAKINLFLGIFNMIPIPGFDGFQVIRHVINLF